MFTQLGKPAIALLLAGILSPIFAQNSNDSLLRQYYEQAQAALRSGNYPEAEKGYEKLRELSPGTPEIYANLGLIYFQEKKFDAAATTLRRALKLNPNLPKAESLLAISLAELGRYKEAIPGLEKGFRQSTDPNAKRTCGLHLERAYVGLQKDGKAVETALELNRLYPDDPEVLYHTGRLFGNFAFLTMERLAKIAPTSVWRYQAEAEAYESQGATEEALSSYRQVLALDPQRPQIHYRIARTLLARSERQDRHDDDVDRASHEFEQELAIDPTDIEAAYELAEIERKAGSFDRASNLFELVLERDPQFEDARLGLASSLLALQKPQDALVQLQKAIAENPKNEVSWYRLGIAQRALGNHSEETKAFAEFRRLHQEAESASAAAKMFSAREVTKQEVDANATSN
jgi:tetratricopeptide (TPR) repeat protein